MSTTHDVIATRNVTSSQQWTWRHVEQWTWRHCYNERGVIATTNVTSLQEWTWRHCYNERGVKRDIIARMNVTSLQQWKWRHCKWTWRHCNKERDVIATTNVTSSQQWTWRHVEQWTWRHCYNEHDVMGDWLSVSTNREAIRFKLAYTQCNWISQSDTGIYCILVSYVLQTIQ